MTTESVFVIRHVGTGVCLSQQFPSRAHAEVWMKRDKRFKEPFWEIEEFPKEEK